MTSHETPGGDGETLTNANPCVDREILTNANLRVDRDMLTNGNLCIELEVLANVNLCADREKAASRDNYCEISDMLTSNDSIYSNDQEQFWCDLCGSGLKDIISLKQHAAEHIVDLIADKNDTYASHTLHADLLSNQEPVNDGDVNIKLEDTTLGLHIFL